MGKLKNGGYLLDDSSIYLSDSLDDEKSKSLTEEHKQAMWEGFAQKTARQETMFKRVFDNVLEEQKSQMIEQLEKTGQILVGFDDAKTAQKFQPAIELIYHSAFEDAV